MNWPVVTVVCAATAAAVNLTAAVFQARNESMFLLGRAWTLTLAWTGLFACFYAGAFAVLEWWPGVDRAAWSRWLTPFSALSFITVWTAPALLAAVKVVRYRAEGRRLYEQVSEP